MARKKNPSPMRREPSEVTDRSNGAADKSSVLQNGHSNGSASKSDAAPAPAPKQAGIVELAVCVGGIYASFLSWALLQERITTTRYGPPAAPETFTYAIFLNTIQSAFAALTGYIYLLFSSRGRETTPSIFPSQRILFPLALVAVTSSLASPFGYASLQYIDYVTFILAKSCKLLPVMLLHVSVFRKSYPLYKYAVVAAVTLGVAVFTLHHPSTAKKASKTSAVADNQLWGLGLLGVNLLFDGITNATQDHIFTAFRPFSGPQMMCAQNVMSTALTVLYLVAEPYVAATPVGAWVGMKAGAGELKEALAFVARYPEVGGNVLMFAGCGAVGQVFIFYTLSQFSSLLLVTVTVTRKMLTMVLSVLWFGHSISGMQWLGVGLVFGGVGAEGVIARREKKAKEGKKVESKEL